MFPSIRLAKRFWTEVQCHVELIKEKKIGQAAQLTDPFHVKYKKVALNGNWITGGPVSWQKNSCK